jgi:RNA polymerase sigma factor for flagellar operon FliA
VVIGREHLRVVHDLAWKIMRRSLASLSHDELVSAGLVGLVQAAQSYDGSRGTTFTTWAYRRVEGAMLDELRASGEHTRGEVARHKAGLPTKRRVPMSELRGLADERSEPVDEALARVRDGALLRAAVAQLKPRSRKIIEAYYFEGRALDEAAGGLTKSWASRLLDQAEAELRKRMGVAAPPAKVSRARGKGWTARRLHAGGGAR